MPQAATTAASSKLRVNQSSARSPPTAAAETIVTRAGTNRTA